MTSLIETRNSSVIAMETVTNATSRVGMTTTLYDHMEDQNKIFTPTDAILVTTFLAILSVFGIIANAITFLVIIKLPRTIFNVILASLCVSDFLSAIDSPFVIYRSTYGYRYFELSEAVCKIAQAVDFWTTAVTIQHILLFAILRFISIQNPHKFRRINVRHALITVIVIWIETLLVGFVCFVLWPGVSIPPAHAFGGRSCRMKKKWVPMAKIYSLYIFPILLYLPMLLVVVLCIAVCVVILKKRHEEKGEKYRITTNRSERMVKKENFALLQLSLIVASFLLGYIPDISYRATAIIAKSRRNPLKPRVEWLFSVIAHCFLRISECLNPIFYNLGSSKMRAETKTFLGKCCKSESDDLAGSKSNSSGNKSSGTQPSTPRTHMTRF